MSTDHIPTFKNGRTLSELAWKIRSGEILKIDNIAYASMDIILNCFSIKEISKELTSDVIVIGGA